VLFIINRESGPIFHSQKNAIHPVGEIPITEMRAMSEQPTAVERKEAAYQTVRDFWETYGDVLQQENGPGTFKHALVQKMKQVYEDIVAGSDGAMIHRKILDILGEQRKSIIQFESCLDEFNRYLASLRLLDTFMLHGICMHDICPQPSERNRDEGEQVQRLLAFLAPVMSLETQEDRLRAYREAWVRLNPAAEKEVWKSDLAMNFPWSTGKVDLWRTLRRDIEEKFQTTLNKHLNGECTNRPVVEFSFMDYSNMLFELLDIFLKGLDEYIGKQDHITAVSGNPGAYESEDELHMSEKSMRHSRLSTAQDFLDVILFMHAVPQRAVNQWDALDHGWDVSWFREHCEVYQKNEELMAFLRDCAVVVLIVGHFHVAKDVQSIHHCYRKLNDATVHVNETFHTV